MGRAALESGFLQGRESLLLISLMPRGVSSVEGRAWRRTWVWKDRECSGNSAPFGTAAWKANGPQDCTCICRQIRQGFEWCAMEFGFGLYVQLRSTFIYKQRSVVFELRL